MSNLQALIIWGSLSIVTVAICMRLTGMNLKEKISMASLGSGISAGALCGFTVSVSWGLGISAGILCSLAVLLGYEG
ncbi:MAG: hypothetical protein CM15mV33_660 [uncultured marine virus]|jgi:hypothetical protein|nr:MAG: hypothetical protein CM15mV33_660 [uncultured marine virus]|tara:strand:+ start:313 stop:543 length:231 start_codon:yes stop_codon:yes gene_type:complete